MPNKSEHFYKEWFGKAEEDWLSAEVIIKEGGAPSTACFLSQQIAEKYLKGLLTASGHRFPKIHDLIELEKLLSVKFFEINELEEDLKFLNRYYVETRYPGDYPVFSLKDAHEALAAARRVKEFVLGKIQT